MLKKNIFVSKDYILNVSSLTVLSPANTFLYMFSEIKAIIEIRHGVHKTVNARMNSNIYLNALQRVVSLFLEIESLT